MSKPACRDIQNEEAKQMEKWDTASHRARNGFSHWRRDHRWMVVLASRVIPIANFNRNTSLLNNLATLNFMDVNDVLDFAHDGY